VNPICFIRIHSWLFLDPDEQKCRIIAEFERVLE
jgi:hypothetical protein